MYHKYLLQISITIQGALALNHKLVSLTPGLYLVATPLGTARDITLRALDILASADVIAAEDTRTARKLLEIHGIPLNGRRIIAYHDHSKATDRDRLIQMVLDGKSVAYASEAGTPLIADPGYQLVVQARALGAPVIAAPGPSACIAALSVAGLPTDRFHFAGFLPSTATARRTQLTDLLALQATIVLYESPKRVLALARDIADIGGQARKVSICRELTKKFEEVITLPAADLIHAIEAKPPKGEIVVLIEPGGETLVEETDLNEALVQAMLTMRVKDAADAVAGAYNLSRRDVYQMALKLKQGE